MIDRPQLRAMKAGDRGTSVYWTLQAEPGDIRRETWRGVEHVIVPMVALVEGVIQCSTCPEPELALASEFAKVLEAWNGRAVTMRHPVDAQGVKISANAPGVLASYQIGQTFNAELVDDVKLRVEAWLNPELVEAVGDEAKATLERIEAGERVQVSVGMFANAQTERGRFEGRTYSAVQREIRPDHVAILGEGETGACSWEDGCGVRANALRVASCRCGGACSQGEERLEARRETIETRVLQTIASSIEPGARLAANAEGMSDADLRTALTAALRKVLTDSGFWIVAVFRDSVIYETWDSAAFLERAYTLSGEQVTLADEVIEVRPVTRMVPARRHRMDRDKLIAQLIDNSATRYSADDRAWLEGLTDAQLAKLEPAEARPPDPDELTLEDLTVDQLRDAATARGLEVREPEPEPQTTQEALAAMPAAIRAPLERAMRADERRKADLVAAIGEKTKAYDKVELEAMTTDGLEKLAVAVQVQSPGESTEYVRRVPGSGSSDPAPTDYAAPPAPRRKRGDEPEPTASAS